MISVSNLQILLSKLNTEERKQLQKILQSRKSEQDGNKTLKLVGILLEEKKINHSDIQVMLYGKENYMAFNKICSRLKEKILDVILLDPCILSSNYSKRNEVLFSVKKKIIQADILNLKGLRDDADSVIKKMILLSKEYEMYDLVIQALQIREKFAIIRKLNKEIQKIKFEILQYNDKHLSLLNAQSQFNFMMNKISSISNKINYKFELQSTIEALESSVILYQSSIVKYYCLILSTELFQINNEFKKADSALDKAIEILSKKSVYTNNRMGAILLSKSDNYLRMFDFSKSIEYGQMSNIYFPNNKFNKSLVVENNFFCNLYTGNLDLAFEDIKSLVNMTLTNITSTVLNKYKYFEGVVFFLQENFDECLACFNDLKEIEKDKDGWNINIRILTIMALIERKDYEAAELQIENLKSFFKRVSKKSVLGKRYGAIIKIFVILENNAYNFKTIRLLNNQSFVKMINMDEGYEWQIKGPELIAFEAWISSKQENTQGLYHIMIRKFDS